MDEEEIIKAIEQVSGIEGMTVNERLYATGLMDEFDFAKKRDKTKARRILELLQVDTLSINRILKSFF